MNTNELNVQCPLFVTGGRACKDLLKFLIYWNLCGKCFSGHRDLFVAVVIHREKITVCCLFFRLLLQQTTLAKQNNLRRKKNVQLQTHWSTQREFSKTSQTKHKHHQWESPSCALCAVLKSVDGGHILSSNCRAELCGRLGKYRAQQRAVHYHMGVATGSLLETCFQARSEAVA